jgi:hypothetical protein
MQVSGATLCPLGQSKKAIRPRVSDRTTHCHSWEWTIVRLVVSENEGRRHDNEMGITGQKELGLLPYSWAECREKKIGIEPKESYFFLTFLFIGFTGC